MTQSKTNAAEWIEKVLLPLIILQRDLAPNGTGYHRAFRDIHATIVDARHKWQSEAPTCDCRYKQNTVCDICQGIGGADKPTGAGWTNYESITVFGAREPKQYVPIEPLTASYFPSPLSHNYEAFIKVPAVVDKINEIIQRLTRAGI